VTVISRMTQSRVGADDIDRTNIAAGATDCGGHFASVPARLKA